MNQVLWSLLLLLHVLLPVPAFQRGIDGGRRRLPRVGRHRRRDHLRRAPSHADHRPAVRRAAATAEAKLGILRLLLRVHVVIGMLKANKCIHSLYKLPFLQNIVL